MHPGRPGFPFQHCDDACEMCRRLSTIADSAPVLISYLDLERRYVYVNKAYEETWGRPRLDILGKHPEDLLVGSSEQIHPRLDKAFAGDRVNYELAWNRPNSAERHIFEVTYAPDKDIHGKVQGVVVVARDITDRRIREEAQQRTVEIASVRSQIVTIFSDPLLSVRESIKKCTDLLLACSGAAFVRIWTFNSMDNVLELQASSGMYEHIDGKHSRIALGQLEIGRIAQHRRPHVTNDVINDAKIGDRPWVRRKKLVAFAGYPLLAGRTLAGVVALFSKQPVGSETIELLGSISDVLAQAIERKRSEELLRRLTEDRRLLAEASALLGSSLDYETTLENVARLVIPGLGDWCGVDLAHNGKLYRTALTHSDPNKVRQIEEYSKVHPLDDKNASCGPYAVMRTGQPVVVPVIDDRMLQSAAPDEATLEFFRSLHLKSYMCVPLRARGRVLGAVSFATAESGRIYDQSDLGLAEELANRIAVSIDNSRLYRSATTREQQMSFLADLSSAISKSLDYSETAQTIARLLVASLCDYAVIFTVNPEGVLQRTAAAHRDIVDAGILRRILESNAEPDWENSVLSVIQTAVSLVLPEVRDQDLEAAAGDPEQLNLLRRLKPTSCIVAPLKARGRSIGALCVAMTDSGRRLTAADAPFIEEIGGRAAIALDNAALYRASLESSRMKDQFLAVLSHELRTPLTSVYGWLSLMQQGKVPQGQMSAVLQVMDRNVRAQISIIDELLDLSRIVEGGFKLNIQNVDPLPVILSCIESIKPTVKARRIGLDFDNRIREPITVHADTTRLQQIIWNLLSNAVKFTPENGSISILTELDGDRFTTTVRDTGVGIEPDFLPFIFDKFRQGDPSSTRHHGGLGVGLSIVKHLTEMHGGAVQAYSEGAGRGATFKVSLPAYRMSKTKAS